MARRKPRGNDDYGSLLEWRKAKRLTQSEAARVLGMDRSTLAHLEAGRAPGGQTAVKLHRITGVDLVTLLNAQ